jgi:peroxiredoxin
MELDFDIVELEPADPPEKGTQAPDFARPLVNDEFWEDVALSELTADGPVLLVFHPMDGAFPATYIWNELRDRAWDETYDVTIVGCSIATPYAHRAFIDDRAMDYRLFSDPQNGVGEAYGVVHNLDGMAGVSEHRPAVFLVDGEQMVRYAWVAQEWPAFPDYGAVADALDAHC